ncbi:MAG: hypothetical protein QCI38_02880 [Candidatus Thermoplasmatota archaeon]|nr:hypothetical protein [Candidatus Thermoplasmatota archaeon]
MEKSKDYVCEVCGKAEKKSGGAPECCGKEMTEKLPICIDPPASPEHARPMKFEEPCDDSRGK